MSSIGKVYLVGAGPGDPGLLTQKAVSLMETCDVVCYDLLIDSAILAQIPATTKMIPVGYRGYCGASIEYGMHPTVIEQALLGKNVLRLKAGDPFIFGRATEECRSLNHHGISFEVVPGITSALGAAAYAGFPLTSNGMASDVMFASGHKVSKAISNWVDLGVDAGTLVLYMGAKKLQKHAQTLLERGKEGSTPVAVVSAATSYKQRELHSTLAKIGDLVVDFDNGDPMLVIMGEVVALSPELNWRAQLPLSQTSVIVDSNNPKIINQLNNLGATIVKAPSVFVEHCIDDMSWQRIVTAKSLWLASDSAAKSLWETSRKQQLDVRHWHWQLSGTSSAHEYLSELGIYPQVSERPHDDMLTLGLHASENKLKVYHQEVIRPGFEMQPSSFAVVEQLCIAEYLSDNHLLTNEATIFTQSQAVREYLLKQGYECELFLENQSLESVLNRIKNKDAA